MNHPTISLHQPRASLCVTRQPHDFNRCHCDQWGRCLVDCPTSDMPMIKRFETRSWPCPPKLIGSRILIHATQRQPEYTYAPIGDWVVDLDGTMRRAGTEDRRQLPLGAIVGSATIEACGPITTQEAVENDTAPLDWLVKVYDEGAAMRIPRGIQSVKDQLPFGDYRPGRYAWLLTDAAPTTERCPWCWGEQYIGADPNYPGDMNVALRCPICLHHGPGGRCDPIRAKGHQRIWNWNPT